MKTALLELVRDEFTLTYTTGRLYLNGVFFCYTVEDVVREGDIRLVKVKGKTAIPAGRYPVQVTYSPSFGKMMALLLNVPGFSGIRMHNGVGAQSSEGCIICSDTALANGQVKSDQAWKRLRDALGQYDRAEIVISTGVKKK